MKRNRKCSLLAAVLVGTLMLVGCGSSNSDASNNGKNKSATKILPSYPKIDQLDWHVDSGVVDEQRRVLMDYTNNSKYTIVEFDLTFTQKSDVTDEQGQEELDKVKELLSFSDDDLSEVKDKPLSGYVDSVILTRPGDTSTKQACYYYSGIFYMQDMSFYDLLTPDIATIKYIDNDTVHTVSYDFKSKNYTEDTDTTPAKETSKNSLTTDVPMITSDYVKVDDYETSVYVTSYGITSSEYEKYCKEFEQIGYELSDEYFNTKRYVNTSVQKQVELTYDSEKQSVQCVIEQAQ